MFVMISRIREATYVSYKALIKNIQDFEETIQSIEDENMKGRRAVESAIDSISKDMINFYNSQEGSDPATSPEDVLKINQAVAEVTTKSVAASHSGKQEDVIAVANNGRIVISNLFKALKVCFTLLYFSEVNV